MIGSPIIDQTHASQHPVAPGQLKSHYATITPLFIGEAGSISTFKEGKKIALIEFGNPAEGEFFARYNLSEKGDLDEAAGNLFSIMREADHCGADLILAAPLPEYGLGRAINDRLRRAQFTSKE